MNSKPKATAEITSEVTPDTTAAQDPTPVNPEPIPEYIDPRISFAQTYCNDYSEDLNFRVDFFAVLNMVNDEIVSLAMQFIPIATAEGGFLKTMYDLSEPLTALYALSIVNRIYPNIDKTDPMDGIVANGNLLYGVVVWTVFQYNKIIHESPTCTSGIDAGFKNRLAYMPDHVKKGITLINTMIPTAWVTIPKSGKSKLPSISEITKIMIDEEWITKKKLNSLDEKGIRKEYDGYLSSLVVNDPAPATPEGPEVPATPTPEPLTESEDSVK